MLSLVRFRRPARAVQAHPGPAPSDPIRARAVLPCLIVLGLLLVAGCVPANNLLERPRTGQAGPGPLSGAPPAGSPTTSGDLQPLIPPTPTMTGPQPPTTVIASGTRIGLLLPLSGQLGNVGKALLNAAQMAVFDLAKDDLKLLPRDTGGTPEGAASAARALADEGVGLILGPLLSQEVVAAGNAIQGRGINIVAFSNDQSAARPGSVFVMGMQPGGEVERVASYATARGLKNFGVLAADDAYGAIAIQALQKTAPMLGINIARITLLPASANARETASVVKGFAAGIDPPLDLLLLPMTGPRLSAAAAMLPYYEVDPKKVQFAGTSLWDQTDVSQEPALANAWYPAPPPEERAEFVRDYSQMYGTPPPRIATLGYDAAALAAVLAQTVRPDRFSAEAITQPNGFAGVDGLFRFRPDGTAQRGLAMYQVNRPAPRLIDPAPSRFSDMVN